jgi:hypothetical protein
MAYGVPKKPTLSKGRKKDDGSYSRVEDSRLAKKGKKRYKAVPLPKMPAKPGTKVDPGFKKGPTPSPTPTQYGSNGTILLNSKKSSSKKNSSMVSGGTAADKKKAQLKALQEQTKKSQEKKKKQIKTLTSQTVKAKKNNSSTRKGQR